LKPLITLLRKYFKQEALNLNFETQTCKIKNSEYEFGLNIPRTDVLICFQIDGKIKVTESQWEKLTKSLS